MSTYATEFEHTDDAGDELFVNRCVYIDKPAMLHVGDAGVELWRDDVARFAEYLAGIVDTVPERPSTEPAPPVRFESAGAIVGGRLVCVNTFAANRAARRRR